MPDRKRTKKQKRREKLLHAEKMEHLGIMVSGVAHDYNNLLMIIRGYSELLVMQLEPKNLLCRSALEIQKAVDRAVLLTSQLLTYTRGGPFDLKNLDLNAIVVGMDKLLECLLGGGIELVTDLDPSLAQVKAVPGQIEQVILNLVINARDAMPEGGIVKVETANVEVDTPLTGQLLNLPKGSYTMLAVSDTGTGMDPETQSKVFQPFFTTKEPGKGTGLGLANVGSIVSRHGGYVRVDSKLGQGSAFRIYLRCIS